MKARNVVVVAIALVAAVASGCGKGIESTSGSKDKAPAASPAAKAPAPMGSTGGAGAKTSTLTLGSWSVLPGELPREYKVAPTATLLSDGSILVWGHEAAPKGALLDVAAGRFSDTTDGRFPRREHAAVVLADGKVMFTGGANVPKNFYVMRSVTVYDPTAKTVTKSESMLSQRRGHSAHVASDGKVYVIGGMAGGLVPPTKNVDVFDPSDRAMGRLWPTSARALWTPKRRPRWRPDPHRRRPRPRQPDQDSGGVHPGAKDAL